MDNFYLRERLAGEEAAGRASVSPGLFYRFRVASDIELVCFDTSKENFFRRGRLFVPEALGLHAARVSADRDRRHPMAHSVRHHPPFCAGPQHGNTDRMEEVVRLFEAAACASASAATSTTSSTRLERYRLLRLRAGSKVRRSVPNGFAEAHTVTWSGQCHFLLVTVDGSTMTVRAIGESPEVRSATFRG